MSEAYGSVAGDASTASPATGAAGDENATAPLLRTEGGRLGIKKGLAPEKRFWRDIAICSVSLLSIVGTFFLTLSFMNYEDKRTTFEVHTE
jgi:hypothetical protein